MEQRHFFQASLDYVFLLQEVHERKKFEFVETVLSFMYGWLTFYHQGYDVAKDFKSFATDLQIRLQRTRNNFNATHSEAEQLKQKMLEKPQDPGSLNKMYTRQGYLFLMEKKALGTTWGKHFCQYQKGNRRFTMIPYSQTTGKITTTDSLTLNECIRRMSDSIDKRFCFDITAIDRPGIYTFQALSEEDRRLWLDAMDGKEPAYSQVGKNIKSEEYSLDEVGFLFVKQCLEVIEARGLEDEGLYRLVGVSSKVTKLTQMALDKKKSEKLNLDDSEEWEIKTITSALKNYFRNLPEPLMTFRLHSAFITAAKQENKVQRIVDIHSLIHQLPKPNFEMLKLLIRHLHRVAKHSHKNLMTVSNLGVCFGPTLLRPEEETVAAIMDIKFGNIVVEILIENCEQIFDVAPAEKEKKNDSIPSETRSPTNHPPQMQNHHPHTSASEPVAPQRKGKRDLVSTMELGRPPGRNVLAHPAYSYSSPHRPDSAYGDSLVHKPQKNILPQHMHPQSLEKPAHQMYDCPTSIPASQSSGTEHAWMTQHFQHSNAAQLSKPISQTQSWAKSSSRSRGKPLVVYNPSWNDSHTTSSSSSSESLSSRSSSTSAPHQSASHSSPSLKSTSSHHQASSSHTSPSLKTSPSQRRHVIDKAYSPAHSPGITGVGRGIDGHRESDKPRRTSRSTHDMVSHQRQGSTGTREFYTSGGMRQNSIYQLCPSTSSSSLSLSSGAGRRVRTLYACVGENDSELSFEPNQVIYNVRPSREPGWLEGCLNGRIGLIPENYVEYLPGNQV